MSERLAIEGGEPVRKELLPSVLDSISNEELDAVTEVIRDRRLTTWNGTKVAEFEKAFCRLYGVKHAIASTSGTAAVHIAVAALDLKPGDEVIVPAVTDFGSVIGVVLQNAIPIFADVDPKTCNVSPTYIEKKTTGKTKAILVVHLFGQPCAMEDIMDLAEIHNLYVVEDCAQAHLAEYRNRKVGSIGDISCFSLLQGKHMTTGEGGITLTNDEKLARRAELFSRRANLTSEREGIYYRTHPFIAPNYRMTELQGAIGLAQLKKLDSIVRRRIQIANKLTTLIKKVEGLSPLEVIEGVKHVYWLYPMELDIHKLGISNYEFARALNAELGSPSTSPFSFCMPKEYFLVYSHPAFLERRGPYGLSHCPFDCPHHGEPVSYRQGLCPNAEVILKRLVTLSLNENYGDKDVQDVASALQKVVRLFRERAIL